MLTGIDCTPAQVVLVRRVADCDDNDSSVELAHDVGVGGIVVENVAGGCIDAVDVGIVAEAGIAE